MRLFWPIAAVGIALFLGAMPLTWCWYANPLATWVGWNVLIGMILGMIIPFSMMAHLFNTNPRGIGAAAVLLPLIGFLLVLGIGYPLSLLLRIEIDTSDFEWGPVTSALWWRGALAFFGGALGATVAMAPLHERYWPQAPGWQGVASPASPVGNTIRVVVSVVALAALVGLLSYRFGEECYLVDDYSKQPNMVLIVFEDANAHETSKTAKLIVPGPENTVINAKLISDERVKPRVGFLVPRTAIDAGGLKYKVSGSPAWTVPDQLVTRKMRDLER